MEGRASLSGSRLPPAPRLLFLDPWAAIPLSRETAGYRQAAERGDIIQARTTAILLAFFFPLPTGTGRGEGVG